MMNWWLLLWSCPCWCRIHISSLFYPSPRALPRPLWTWAWSLLGRTLVQDLYQLWLSASLNSKSVTSWLRHVCSTITVTFLLTRKAAGPQISRGLWRFQNLELHTEQLEMYSLTRLITAAVKVAWAVALIHSKSVDGSPSDSTVVQVDPARCGTVAQGVARIPTKTVDSSWYESESTVELYRLTRIVAVQEVQKICLMDLSYKATTHLWKLRHIYSRISSSQNGRAQ